MKDFIDTTFAWVWEYALPSECVSLIEAHIVCSNTGNSYIGIWVYLSPTGVFFVEKRLELFKYNRCLLPACRLECLRSVLERYAQILPEDHPMVDVIECIERKCMEVML